MPLQRCIGIFDSGLGGLTVLKEIRSVFPEAPIVYLGDTARVPYGTRSADTVRKYALKCAHELVKHDVSQIVVACNTVSAVALDTLRFHFEIPILGVIEPGATTGLQRSKNKHIGVLATAGTVASKAYEQAIHSLDPNAKVMSIAAPLLVPLVEEGWLDGQVPQQVIRTYLEKMNSFPLDTLILGCTHYPLLKTLIEQEATRQWGYNISVVDSAQATAQTLLSFEKPHEKTATVDQFRETTETTKILVTDIANSFSTIASTFLDQPEETLEITQIDLT